MLGLGELSQWRKLGDGCYQLDSSRGDLSLSYIHFSGTYSQTQIVDTSEKLAQTRIKGKTSSFSPFFCTLIKTITLQAGKHAALD